MNPLTHFDADGASRMVDVTAKPETLRRAVAVATVRMKATTLELILNKALNKGDVLEVARLAGIMAAKKTADLIPLCHPLPLTAVTVDFEAHGTTALTIRAETTVFGRTGVEMEALTAVSIAALTVYDMAKAVDRDMTITDVALLAKSGGRSGQYHRPPQVMPQPAT